MRLSFVPGDLYLTDNVDGSFTVTFQGNIVFKTKTKNAAVAKYNAMRKELESKFPTPELTPEQKAEIRRQAALDSIVAHNSLRPEPKRKPGKSRTFGD